MRQQTRAALETAIKVGKDAGHWYPDDLRSLLEAGETDEIEELKARNERLALTNRMLRDKIKDLIDHLADFGVYVQP